MRISPLAQAALASALIVGFVLWLGVSAIALVAHWQRASERANLQQRAGQIQREDRNLQHNRRQLDARTQTLESRQSQLEAIARRYLGSQVSQAPARKAERQSSLVPIDRRLAVIEQRQLGFASAVTRVASAQQGRHRATLASLGLPMPRGDDARGGPFIAYAGPVPSDRSAAGSLAAMQDALSQWQASTRLMTALPAGLPVGSVDLTSAFGVRADPFTHRAALHPGQDFRGAYGSPIMAAGVGRVIHAGWMAGYGKAVMIDHGYKLVSLYGHMSRVLVRDGQSVGRGDALGLIGSTGRSTGPHLHFEVRLGGRSINPWPLMEMNHVR